MKNLQIITIFQIVFLLIVGILSVEIYTQRLGISEENIIIDLQLSVITIYFVLEYLKFRNKQVFRQRTFALLSIACFIFSLEHFAPNTIWIPQIIFWAYLFILIILNLFIYKKITH